MLCCLEIKAEVSVEEIPIGRPLLFPQKPREENTSSEISGVASPSWGREVQPLCERFRGG